MFNQYKNLDPEDYYHHENGYLVFTEKYHLKRGYCCESGCRHCPYGYKEKLKKKKLDELQRRNKTRNS
ncbi:hypothetical protein KFE98_08955 [bacterium SCSIO 12741]|nr:hypothetical protein KFE98_08955 [bacterium SCSIO 12741]